MSSQPPRLSSAEAMRQRAPVPPSGSKSSKLLIALGILVILFLLVLLAAGAVVLGDKALEALNLCWGDC